MTYNTRRLKDLGLRFRDLRDELEELRPQLAEEILLASQNGVRQIDIVHETGYTREVIRRICDPTITRGGRSADSDAGGAVSP